MDSRWTLSLVVDSGRESPGSTRHRFTQFNRKSLSRDHIAQSLFIANGRLVSFGCANRLLYRSSQCVTPEPRVESIFQWCDDPYCNSLVHTRIDTSRHLRSHSRSEFWILRSLHHHKSASLIISLRSLLKDKQMVPFEALKWNGFRMFVIPITQFSTEMHNSFPNV